MQSSRRGGALCLHSLAAATRVLLHVAAPRTHSLAPGRSAAQEWNSRAASNFVHNIAAIASSSSRRHGLGATGPGRLPLLGGRRWHCDEPVAADAATVTIVFVDKDGKEYKAVGREGQNLVHVAHENNVELEGACECSLACSTCHVILEDRVYSKLGGPVDEEEDLLDLAFGLTATSRLGCQVRLEKTHDGMRIRLPAATRNFYVDGHKPKPH